MVHRIFIIAALLIAIAISFVAGTLVGERRSLHRQYLEERALIAPTLTAEPAFGRIEIREFSAGGAYLMGELDTTADHERLRAALVPVLGEAKMKILLAAVSVRR